MAECMLFVVCRKVLQNQKVAFHSGIREVLLDNKIGSIYIRSFNLLFEVNISPGPGICDHFFKSIE